MSILLLVMLKVIQPIIGVDKSYFAHMDRLSFFLSFFQFVVLIVYTHWELTADPVDVV